MFDKMLDDMEAKKGLESSKPPAERGRPKTAATKSKTQWLQDD